MVTSPICLHLRPKIIGAKTQLPSKSKLFADEPFRRYIGAKIEITMGAYGNEKRNFSPFHSIGFPNFEPIWRRNGATPTPTIWWVDAPWYQVSLVKIWC